jgi:hypothetical protein
VVVGDMGDLRGRRRIELDARSEHEVVRAGAAEQDVAAVAGVDGVVTGGGRDDRRADGRPRRQWHCRFDGLRNVGVIDLRDVGVADKPAFAVHEVDVHQTVGVGCVGAVFQSEHVSQFVGHGGQQVEMARRGARRIGQQIGRRAVHSVGEFGIVARRRVDEPAMPGGVDIDGDVSGRLRADDVGGQIRHAEDGGVQRRQLGSRCSVRGPLADCSGNNGVEFGLAQVYVS